MDDVVAIRDFFAGNAGAFCDECLSRPIGLPQDELKAAIFMHSRSFTRVLGHCGWCGRSPLAVTSMRRAA